MDALVENILPYISSLDAKRNRDESRERKNKKRDMGLVEKGFLPFICVFFHQIHFPSH